MRSNQELSSAELRGSPVFAGVDWGGSFHQLCVLDEGGVLIVEQQVSHDVPGLALLAAQVDALDAPVLLAIERAEGLLVEFLLTLPRGACQVFCVSDRLVVGLVRGLRGGG